MSCGSKDDITETAIWIKDGGFILIVYGLTTCFYALAFVCDEYFVRSLEVFIERFKVPENVAGATLMAVGTSAPDVFISYFGLYLLHSQLGVGTIVGSTIFNHLCTCAACVYFSKGGNISLDPKVVTREVLFYLIALLLLMVALQGSFQNGTLDMNQWNRCLTVEWWGALIMLLGYVVYAVVVSNFNRICIFLTGSPPRGVEVGKGDEHAVEANTINSGSTVAAQPSTSRRTSTVTRSSVVMVAAQRNQLLGDIHPSAPLDVEVTTVVSHPERSLDGHSQSSGPSDTVVNPLSREADPSKTEHSPGPSGTHGRRRSTVVAVLFDQEETKHNEPQTYYQQTMEKIEEYWEIINFPVRFLIVNTIPNLEDPKWEEYYGLTIFMSIVWLGIISELTCECIGELGQLMGVSLGLMGLTVSAIGASLPDMWSSVIVARQVFSMHTGLLFSLLLVHGSIAGRGDMAISNAMGANSFSVMGALGSLWLTYILYTGQPRVVQDGGIAMLIFLNVLVVIIFYLLIVFNDWTLKSWMAPLFLGTYVFILGICAGLVKA